MREQPVDLRQSLAILRRRWIAIAVAGIIGLCGGFLYALLHAPQHRAAVQIILPLDIAGAPWTAANTQTQIIIVTSNAVLAPVAESASPPITVQQLQHLVSGSAEGANVLRIEVRAPTATRAVDLAGAVASQYQKYVKTHNQVAGLTIQIGNATPVTPPSLLSLAARDGLLGLAAGLIVGTVVVLIRGRRDRRLRQRDQIAGAIGVPVVASTDAEQYKSVADWIHLLERFDPSAMKAWTLRRVLRDLVPAQFTGEVTIHVVCFAGDKSALAIGPELALFAAGSGIPTRLAPDENVALEPLIAACAALRGSNQVDQLLTFGSEHDMSFGRMGRPIRWDDDPALIEPHLVVSVVAVEPSRPELNSIVGPTILAVSSGFAVVDDLARVALASARAGLGIDGIVVVNPEPADSTTGLLPDRMGGRWKVPESNRRTGSASPPRIPGGATWRA
jgi:capsular polysaccharide biosynthesis protein